MPAPNHLVTGLQRVAELLSGWPHAGAIIGGVAMIARVHPRHTDDIDVVLTIPDGATDDFLDAARRHGFDHDPTETRQLLEGGLLRLFLPPSRAAGLGVDVIIVDSAFLKRVVGRASSVDLGMCTLPVASVEDLLLLKLEANRPEDIDDILAIKDAFLDELDMVYITAEAERLGLTASLELYFGHR